MNVGTVVGMVVVNVGCSGNGGAISVSVARSRSIARGVSVAVGSVGGSAGTRVLVGLGLGGGAAGVVGLLVRCSNAFCDASSALWIAFFPAPGA